MTSPSLKNRQTTAHHPATRGETRTLWKQLLAGALCLCVAGVTIASDREGGKPLERLKQRSARQRWRELRGDWQSPPETAPVDAPGALPEMHSTTRKIPNQLPAVPAARPAPVQEPVPASSAVAPVPTPIAIESEEATPVVSRPGAKPPVDRDEPMQHPGSFADVPVHTRVSTPRERVEITLPHWPFQDDLDLVGREPFEEPTDLTEATRPAPAVIEEPTVTELPTLPSQVAELPTDVGSSALVQSETPEPTVDSAPSEIEDSPRPEVDPIARLTPIRDIRPFYDYSRSGKDPHEYLCPRPEGADPNKSYGNCPIESELVPHGSLERNHSIIPVYWAASNVYHNPLYFEDPGLERSGHTFSDVVQPFVSVGRFGAQLVALPYSVALDPVCKYETPLGHYRPGECAPKRHLALPLNREAAITAGAAYTGIIFLIP